MANSNISAVKDPTFQQLVLEAMVAVMAIDRNIDAAEVEAVRTQCDRILGRDVAEPLMRDLAKRADIFETSRRLHIFSNCYSKGDWMVLLRCACAVAKADGETDPREVGLVKEMVKAVGIPGRMVDKCLRETRPLAGSGADGSKMIGGHST